MSGKNIVLKLGDITDSVVDAIVNAGNTWLKLGSGVSGAIAAKGGPEIGMELESLRGALARDKKILGGSEIITSVVEQGDNVVTKAGNLRCKHVIHAAVVGPDPVTEEIVRRAVQNCLARASELRCQSVAFPALGTGTGRLSIDVCAEVMVDEICRFLEGETSLKGVMFVPFSRGDFEVFERVLQQRNVDCRKILPEESSPDRALLEAAARGDLDRAKLLLDAGADPNAVDAATGRTALMLAIDSLYPVAGARRSEVADLLLERGADPEMRDNKGRTALNLARARDLPRVAARLLDEAEGGKGWSREGF